MKYRYEGIGEFEGIILESNLPSEQWGYGTQVSVSHAERLSERDASSSVSDSLTCMETCRGISEEGTPPKA